MTGQAEMFDPTAADAIDLIAHLGDQIPAKHLWPAYLADVFAINEAYNRRRQMDEMAAALDARDRSILLADYIGGRQFYLPTGETLKTALRDAIIYREFKGHNHNALAEKYGVTPTRIYQICAEQRRLFIRERQGKLFNE